MPRPTSQLAVAALRHRCNSWPLARTKNNSRSQKKMIASKNKFTQPVAEKMITSKNKFTRNRRGAAKALPCRSKKKTGRL